MSYQLLPVSDTFAEAAMNLVSGPLDDEKLVQAQIYAMLSISQQLAAINETLAERATATTA